MHFLSTPLKSPNQLRSIHLSIGILGLLIWIEKAIAQQPTAFIPRVSPEPTSTSTPGDGNQTIASPTAHFWPTTPVTLRIKDDAEGAAILNTLSAVQSTWTAGTAYVEITKGVWEAAPTSARSSLSTSGYDWNQIVKQTWYSNVPEPIQSAVKEQENALQSAFEKVSSARRISGGIWRTDLGGVWMMVGLIVLGMGLIW